MGARVRARVWAARARAAAHGRARARGCTSTICSRSEDRLRRHGTIGWRRIEIVGEALLDERRRRRALREDMRREAPRPRRLRRQALVVEGEQLRSGHGTHATRCPPWPAVVVASLDDLRPQASRLGAEALVDVCGLCRERLTVAAKLVLAHRLRGWANERW